MGMIEAKKRILLNEPHIETATGAMASFNTDMRAPIKELKCEFTPVQSGSGDPSPTNVRPISGWTGCNVNKMGKNIAHIYGYSAQTIQSITATRVLSNSYGTTLNTTDFSLPDTNLVVTQSQWPVSDTPRSYRNGYMSIGVDNLIFNEYYDFSMKVSNITNNPLNVSISDIQLGLPSGNQASPPLVNNDVLIWKNVKYTPSSNLDKKDVEFRICGLSFTLSEFMVTPANTTDGVFEPYTNSTYAISFPATKNLLNPELFQTRYQQDIVWAGMTSWNGYADGTLYLQAGDYVVYRVPTTTTPTEIAIYDTTGNVIKQAYHTDSLKFTLNSTQAIGVYLSISSTSGERAIDSQIMLSAGTNISAYEPYGTIYGGYIDIVRGVAVAEWECTVYDGSNDENWALSGTNDFVAKNNRVKIDERNIYPLCDEFLMEQTYLAIYPIRPAGSKAYANDVMEWRAWLAEHPLQAVYPLATPIEYPLTPQLLKSLKGANNIYSDLNGNTTVKYWTH